MVRCGLRSPPGGGFNVGGPFGSTGFGTTSGTLSITHSSTNRVAGTLQFEGCGDLTTFNASVTFDATRDTVRDQD